MIEHTWRWHRLVSPVGCDNWHLYNHVGENVAVCGYSMGEPGRRLRGGVDVAYRIDPPQTFPALCCQTCANKFTETLEDAVLPAIDALHEWLEVLALPEWRQQSLRNSHEALALMTMAVYLNMRQSTTREKRQKCIEAVRKLNFSEE